MMPGLHRVRSRLAGNRWAEYWYAFRGGPRLLKVEANSRTELDDEVSRQAPAAIEAYEKQRGGQGNTKFLAGLITKFKAQMEANQSLADRTKADYRKHLDFALKELGDLEVKALEAKTARSALTDWRDKFSATPKTADDRLGAVAMVLEWAKKKGDIAVNPLVEWPRIYRVNRADLVWEPQDLALLLPQVATDEARYAIMFAAHAGPRVSDLVKIPRSAVKQDAIIWQTGKSRGRRTIIIPITDELRPIVDWLVERGSKTDSLTLLVNSRGKPWTDEGLQTSMQKAKQALNEAAQEATGDPEARSPVDHLRFHDLRGTAATNLVRAGLPLEDVATILGWEKRKVEAIAARYVTGETIALAIVERMKRNKAGGGL